ncbi:MAG: hypothetical protein LC808_34110 [Actinobacteria bacterium]|nr:hypothetical protein [Actinomycetota bacterium]
MGCEHVEHNGERGAVAAATADGQCRGTELPRRDVPPIEMTAVWNAGIIGLLLLCIGALVGSACTVQGLNRQYRRLATERRELNEQRRTLQKISLPLARCAWCANLIVSSRGDYEDGENAVQPGGPFPTDRQLYTNLPVERETILGILPRLV